MAAIKGTFSSGDESSVIQGRALIPLHKDRGAVTLQLSPETSGSAFTVDLEGSLILDSSNARVWSSLGQFTEADDGQIYIIDISYGVFYKLTCSSGTDVRYALSG